MNYKITPLFDLNWLEFYMHINNNNTMDYHDFQYEELKNNLRDCLSLQEFQSRLSHSQLATNPYYLGLLLMHIIRLKEPKTVDYLKILIQLGANINFTEPKQPFGGLDSGKSIFMLACQKGTLKSVLFLLKHETLNVSAEDTSGQNALFYALHHHEDDAVNVILAILADFPHLVNSTSKQRDKSLLTTAAEMGLTKVVEILLKRSADPNLQTQISGNTTLHEILRNDEVEDKKKFELIFLLLKYKANPDLHNYQCESARDIADTYLFDLDGIIKEAMKVQEDEKQLKIESQSINAQTKDEENLSDSFNNFQSESEFSMEEEDQEGIDIESLSLQIWQHSLKSEAVHEAAWNQISHFVNELSLIGRKYELTLEIIGSFATGLWTPFSDIDLTFINRNRMYVNLLNLLREVYVILRKRMKELGIYEIYLNDELKFPNIKIELSQRLHNRKIDITIFQQKNNAGKYVQFIQKTLSLNPFIKPIFFTVHKLLENYNIHRPTKLGLKTYTIFLMILLVVEQYPAYEIGQFFLNFINYYTNYYAYEQTVLQTGEVIKRLNIIDPLNQSNNVGGKDTRTDQLELMFKTTWYGLKQGGEKILPYLFQLHNIFEEQC